MAFIHVEDNAEFSGTDSMIMGHAHYEIDCLDGEWFARLLLIKLDELELSRSQVAAVCSKAGMERGEEVILDEFLRNDGRRLVGGRA